MFTSIISTVAAVVSILSVIVTTQGGVTHVEVNQSSSSSTPLLSTPTVTPTPVPTPDQQQIKQQVQIQINQSTESAKKQLDQQKTEAINQVNEQFSQANKQIEDQKQSLSQQASSSGMPNFMRDELTKMQQQLDTQRQHSIDQINNSFNWPR